MMAQVNVCINGRDYLLNCGAGEQDRLRRVTDYLSSQITRLDRGTKRSGDTNLMLTAALMASDEVLTLREQIKSLRNDIEQARLSEQATHKYVERNEAELASSLGRLATRVNHLVEAMSDEGSSEESESESEGDGAEPIFTARDAAG